jgi:hypothetical protein
VLPKVQAKWPSELKSILADCWQLDEGARPEFRTLLPRVESFHATLLEEVAKKPGKELEMTDEAQAQEGNPGRPRKERRWSIKKEEKCVKV